MLIVNNPSVNAIDIVSAGRRLSIKPKQDGQKLNVSAEDAKAIKNRLSKSHPYLTFSDAQAQAETKAQAQTQAQEQAQAKAEAQAEAEAQAQAEAKDDAQVQAEAQAEESAKAAAAPATGKKGR